MSPAQLVAFEIARDVRVEIESWSIRDAAIDAGVDPAQAVDEARKLMGNLYRAAGVRACRVCGCTDEEGCEEGCSWIEDDLCSACRASPAASAGKVVLA